MTDNVAYQPLASPVAMFGVSFDNVTTEEAIQRIERMIASRKPHYAVTANVDFLAQALEDIELHRILLDADLVLCDGTPLVWVSRVLGNPLPERVAGADLVPELIRVAAEKNYRLFFLGAAPATAERAIERLRRQYPHLTIGFYSPPFGTVLEMDHAEITRRILNIQPDLLFVALGCPKQEKWIAMHYRSLNVPVSIGVGGTVDFLAGQLRRAPVWMQRTGTEWIFRLAQEPRRLFNRYVKDLRVFGWKTLAQWWHLEFLSRRAPRLNTDLKRRVEGDLQLIKLPARMDLAALRQDGSTVENALACAKDCVLNMQDVAFIDSSGVAWLITLQKRLRASNRQMILLAPHRAVHRALKLLRLEHYFSSAPDFDTARDLIAARTREEPVDATASDASTTNPLVWRGEITAANAKRVWEETEAHFTSRLRQEVIIDLSEVRFIDSSGLGVMVRAKKLAEEMGCALTFVQLSPVVTNVVRIARLEGFLLSKSSREPSNPLPCQPAPLVAT